MKPDKTLSFSAGIFALLFFVLAASPGISQTASTGTVVGTVKDVTGAVIGNANIALTNPETGFKQQTNSSGDGAYRFVQLQPGKYSVIVSMQGFQQSTVNVVVNVAQSTLADVTLPLMGSNEHVDVSSNAATVSLQTTNTSIGDVIQHEEVAALPTVQRQITQLAYLQPATTPMIGGGEGSSGGGTIGGGRTDQNSMTLDGIDITDKSEGGYLVPGQIASFPISVDAVQEFRGTVSNPGTDQNRSGGGAFALSIRRGNNQWHGLVYDYYQNSALNANTWTANYAGSSKAPLISNRFGTTIGGPIIKDKTFVFIAYEGFRFPRSTSGSRTGITESLRSGQLVFQDQSSGPSAAGTYRTYNFNRALGNISAACGATGTTACDPRGLGFNPMIAQYFTHYPVANDKSTGDGYNTAGIRGNVRIPWTSDFLVGRLDHNLNSNWRFFAYYLWMQSNQSTSDQLDFDPSRTKGQDLISTSTMPISPRVVVSGATGNITPNLIYDLRFGYNSQGFNWKRETPANLSAGNTNPLQLAYSPSVSIIDQPGNSTVATLPKEAALTTEYQMNNSINWVKGAHLINGGINYQHVNMYHYRLTQGGSIAVPVAQITSYYNSIPASSRPPTCSGTMTNCIRSSDLTTYNQLYAMLVGQWDYTTFFNSRDPNGNAVDSLSHPPSYVQTTEHFEFMGSDVWQMNPSTTLNYGATLTYDTPHRDVDGKDYLLVDSSTNTLIDPYDMIKQKAAAAAKGQAYNQTIAYTNPAHLNGRAIYPSFFTFNPRVGASWNPSYNHGVLGLLLGDRKSVLRGGYALVHDQILGIQTELYGIIGNQLIATSNIITSPTCDAAGTPGAGCVAGSSPFRVGVDGSTFTAAPVAFSIPYTPRAANAVTGAAYGVGNGYGLDPNFHPGSYHSFNFTIQRQLSGDMLVEGGWIGRYGRDLASSVNVNAPPINIGDMSGGSNQTFAQAYDAIATSLRAGGSPQAQPWFENNFGAGATAAFVASQSTNVLQNNVSSVFTAWVDPQLQLRGKSPILNRQFQVLTYQTSNGYLNYNAGFVSLRKRGGHGMSAVLNYTFAKCLDTNGRQSDSLNGRQDNPYNLSYAYGACQADVRQVLQSYGRIEIPSPKSNKLLRTLIGGWATSYIFTANTGTVLEVVQGNTTGYTSSNTQGPTAALVGPRPKVGRYNLGVDGTGKIVYNLFKDATAARNSFRYLTLTGDTFRSNRGNMYGLGQWNLDSNIAKTFNVRDSVKATLTFDFFNIFNHPNLFTPSLNLNTTASTFGRITQDTAGAGWDNIGAGPRRVQSSLRITF